MFDMSMGELAIIGAVALVVIGPEKLPKVARTVGAWVGRMQRYANTVKADIQREMDVDNLRQLEAEMKSAGKSLMGDMQLGLAPLQTVADETNGLLNASAQLSTDTLTTPAPNDEPDLFAPPTPTPAPRDRR
jgi:sec-independent protein translocase protein TatB